MDLQEEKERLEYDLDLIDKSIRAASKISDEQEPSNSENESFTELKENYYAFIDSDSEDENFPSLLNRVMNTKSYIKKELWSNKASLGKLLSLIPKSSNVDKDKLDESDKGKKPIYDNAKIEEPSYKPSYASNIIEKGESSKRKLDSSVNEESSSKKSKQSPTEFIDDLPYNPFDDIGTD